MSQLWIFHTWTFCSGTYHAVHGQHTGGQNARRNCKGGGGGGDKMLAILWNREGKMPILSKHFIYETDDQVNCKSL